MAGSGLQAAHAAVLAAGVVMMLPARAIADQPQGAPDVTVAVALGTFVDGAMQGYRDQMRMSSAVVAIVKDGKVLYSAGYGQASREDGRSADPATSLFHIASVTKLFTWTAVMQLVDQGKLDLDTDVNTYLKTMQIPATYPLPITLRHLMTHTAGFEDGGVGYLVSTDPQHLAPVADALAHHIPARVRPPGVISAYSNYGAALAGLIVQEVSGLSYEDYIREHIFGPLEMKFATVHEPLPASLAPYRVVGYARDSGRFVARPPTFEGGFQPAGAAQISAMDMARFMIAHLEGSYDDHRILTPESLKAMHARAFALDPRLPGMCLGFYELRVNGLRVIAHSGTDAALLFHTALYLVPQEHLGIFVSFSGGDAVKGFMKVFFDRYYPMPAPRLPPPPADFPRTAAKYAGSYQFTRRNETRIDRIGGLTSQLRVDVSSRGLLLSTGAGLSEFVPVGTDFFQEVDGPAQLAFRTRPDGRVTHLFLDSLPFMPLERTAILDASRLWYTVFGVALPVFGLVCVRFACRWREIRVLPAAQRRALCLLAGTAGWGLATCLGTAVMLSSADMVTILSRVPISLQLFLVMPIVLVVLTASLLVAAVAVWRRGAWRLRTRIAYSMVAVAAVALSLFFQHWNLLGWKFG